MVNADAISEELAAMCGPGVAVRMLVLARRQAVTAGTDLRLVLPGPHVLRVMKIQGYGWGGPSRSSRSCGPARTAPRWGWPTRRWWG